MADDNPQNTAVSRAIKRRKELQDIIRAAMQEVDSLDKFLLTWRRLSADAEEEIKGARIETSPNLLLGRAGYGQTQPMFEHYVLDILREAGRPMQSGEIIQAFKERGHALGGNETRTAWNRLWQANKRGVLVNIPRYGYWPADEQPPEKALAEPPPKRKSIEPGRATRDRGKGRRVGRQPMLTEGQIKTLEGWLAEGKKTRKEMARDLGGISVGTVENYRLALLRKREDQTLAEALKELHAERKHAAPSAKKKGPGRK